MSKLLRKKGLCITAETRPCAADLPKYREKIVSSPTLTQNELFWEDKSAFTFDSGLRNAPARCNLHVECTVPIHMKQPQVTYQSGNHYRHTQFISMFDTKQYVSDNNDLGEVSLVVR